MNTRLLNKKAPEQGLDNGAQGAFFSSILQDGHNHDVTE